MIGVMQIVFGFVALAGAISAAVQRDPFGKLISLGILVGGVVPFIVDRGYLDIAVAVSLIAPITTIFILMATRRAEQ